MISFTVSTTALKAAALAAGKLDVRDYLNGILLEGDGDYAFVIGTDGHRLHALRVPVKQGEFPKGEKIIIPRDVIDTIKTDRKADGIKVDFYPNNKKGTLTNIRGSVNFTAKDGMYPDWRRVLPGSKCAVDNPGYALNPDYVMDAFKAMKMLVAIKGKITTYKKDRKGNPIEIQPKLYSPWIEFGPTSKDAVRVRGQHCEEFVGIIMPTREDGPPAVPDWAVL